MVSLKERFIQTVQSLNLKNPVTDIQKKMNRKSKGNISEYLNKENKKEPPRPFLVEFCNCFALDFNIIFSDYFGEEALPEDAQISLSKPKVIIPLGKQVHSRLTNENRDDAYEEWDGLPMYNVPISASFVETYKDTAVYKPQYYLHDPRFRDCDFGAIITGDSMHSEIRHGDFVACKQITDARFIVYGDIYYVVACNGLETCKYVARVKNVRDGAIQRNGRYEETDIAYDDSQILLVPYNRSIDPSPLPKNMILSIYKVRGIIRGY